MTQNIIRHIHHWNNCLEAEQEQVDTIYQTINTFKLPYKYFKKFNILPLNLVEGELDKYFDIETLILENFGEAKHISNKLEYCFKYSKCEMLIENFSKYFNNIPIKFLDETYVFDRVIHKYTKYKQHKIITSQVDINLKLKVREIIDKDISQYNNNISNYLEKIYEKQQELEIEEKRIEDNKKYFIPIDSWCPNSILKFPEEEDYYLDGIIIVKVCNKVVKYTEQYRSHIVRQIKKTELQERLDYFVNNKQGYRLTNSEGTETYSLTGL